MEASNCMISMATKGGFIHGFKVRGKRGEGFQVSHLSFADDTLLFLQGQFGSTKILEVYCNRP